MLGQREVGWQKAVRPCSRDFNDSPRETLDDASLSPRGHAAVCPPYIGFDRRQSESGFHPGWMTTGPAAVICPAAGAANDAPRGGIVAVPIRV